MRVKIKVYCRKCSKITTKYFSIVHLSDFSDVVNLHCSHCKDYDYADLKLKEIKEV